jgi:hypothetical protein
MHPCDIGENMKPSLTDSRVSLRHGSQLLLLTVLLLTACGDGSPSELEASSSECENQTLTQWEQNMLDAHNEWRASVEPAAANMYRLYWDRNIAMNAADWVSSCDPDWPHSPESERENVGGYEMLGENLAFCGGGGCRIDSNITDGSGVGDGEGWWSERLDYTWADDSSTAITAHYTQMVSSNAYAIGCATQRCDAPGPDGWDEEWWWIICQYGPRGKAYWIGTKPYEAGEGGLIEPPANVFEDHCLHH